MIRSAGVRPKLAALVLIASAASGACSDDGPPPAATELPPGCSDAIDVVPDDLSCTGLFEAGDVTRISARARGYAPALSFWTDGADKQRWIDLPDGDTIDGTVEDAWRFPIGTKVWKEISLAGRRIETRYFRKVRVDRWLSAAYLWSDDGLRAIRTDGAEVDVAGSTHHVPSPAECDSCHDGKADRLLGFEMVSLGIPGASGLNLSALAAENRIAPPPRVTALTLPAAGGGDALAWMHVNCGTSCHNATSKSTAFGVGMQLDLMVDEILARPAETWRVYTTTVNVAARTPRWDGRMRVRPGTPGESLLFDLVRSRGVDQMPPIATSVVDASGVDRVGRWIELVSP